MNYTIGRTQKASQVINFICGLLFASFSFCYLAFYQNDYLALLQHFYSHGRNVNHGIIFPVIITLLLVALGFIIQKLVHIPIRFRALHWVPSCLILGWLTSIRVDLFMVDIPSVSNGSVILFIIIYIISYYISLRIQENRSENNSFCSLAWPNMAILMIAFAFVCKVGNTDERLHNELSIERAIGEKRYKDALLMSQKTKIYSPFMAASNAFALSQTGQLSNCYFQYAHEKGSDALLPLPCDSLRPWNIIGEIRNWLGDVPSSQIHVTYFLECLIKDSLATDNVPDYLLLSYLLDRDLHKFTNLLRDYYPPKDTLSNIYYANDSLPRHYSEALCLYTTMTEKPVATLQDSILLDKYQQFRLFRYNLSGDANQCRKDSLTTYWDYYFRKGDDIPVDTSL